MIERPILFSAPMVRAILAGAKTMTRRVVTRRNSDVNGSPPGKLWDRLDWSDASARTQSTLMLAMVGPAAAPHDVHIRVAGPDQTYHRVRPLTEAGDRLWVREHYYVAEVTGCGSGNGFAIFDDEWSNGEPAPRELRPITGQQFGSHAAFHLPRLASRILLEVVSVRVERIQDIDNDDARAEGAQPECREVHLTHDVACHREAFEHLWDEINFKRGFGWATNPWVWVVSFRRVEATEARATA